MAKRIKLCALILACVFLASCAGAEKYQKYSANFFGSFDILTAVTAYTKSKNEFEIYAKMIQSRIEELHQLYDIYNDYDGINNLKTVNDYAGIAPVKVDPMIIELLEYAKWSYGASGGTLNIALGPVLQIWHEYREDAKANPERAALPDPTQLAAAATNTNIDNVEIDRANNTVFLRMEGMALDVGAIAKGFAAQTALDEVVAAGLEAVIINMGGNVVTHGRPMDNLRETWAVGIQDPKQSDNQNGFLDIFYVNSAAVVTSGDYQRFYTVDSVRYHHIIDPETLMPADRYAAVTIVAEDSKIAEVLSTALFILPEAEGRALLQQHNARAIWVSHDNKVTATEDIKEISKNLGGSGG